MTITYRSNLTAGIVSIVFGLAVAYLIPGQIGEEFGAADAVTSRTLPYALAAICVLSGLGLAFQSLVLKKDTVKTARLGQEAVAGLYMLTLLAYCFLFGRGFVLATTFLGFATLAFCRTKKPSHYAIVFACALAMYFLITRVLLVRLP